MRTGSTQASTWDGRSAVVMLALPGKAGATHVVRVAHVAGTPGSEHPSIAGSSTHAPPPDCVLSAARSIAMTASIARCTSVPRCGHVTRTPARLGWSRRTFSTIAVRRRRRRIALLR